MNQNLKHFFYAAILLCGGFYLGSEYGKIKIFKETSVMIAVSYFDNASANLDLHISLLKQLQANETQKLSQKLEELVNADLIALAEYSEVPSNRRFLSILESIKNAKRYRQAHPVTIQNEKASKDIARAFNLVK